MGKYHGRIRFYFSKYNYLFNTPQETGSPLDLKNLKKPGIRTWHLKNPEILVILLLRT